MPPTVDIFNPFERFEIESVLKTLPNGRSNCWKGKSREDQRVVVLKLYDGLLSDEERQYWTRADISGLAKWIEIYPEEKSIFCVRDWIEGISLYEAVDRRYKLADEAQARGYFAKICDALSELHAINRVHGSVKATNLFVADGKAHLSDPMMGTPETPTDSGATMDVLQSIAGIPHYLNPEILQNKQQTPASDVYSLGCVLYEWLTGFAPFRGDNDVLVCYQHLSSEPVPVRQLRPDISEGLAAAVTKCLRKHPIERFANAAGLASALRDGLEGEPSLQIELQPERTKKSIATRLPSARTVILSAADLKCAQEIMRQSPGLSADEVRARILAAQGDPQERQRIPIVPFNANQSKALKDLAGPRKPATQTEGSDTSHIDLAVVQRALAAGTRAAVTAPIDPEMMQRAISNTPKPAVTTPIDPELMQRAIQGAAPPPQQSAEPPEQAPDRYKIPFFATLTYAILATLLIAWAYFTRK